jgi:hypothetical protein
MVNVDLAESQGRQDRRQKLTVAAVAWICSEGRASSSLGNKAWKRKHDPRKTSEGSRWLLLGSCIAKEVTA